MRFLVVRESNRTSFVDGEAVDNPDYHVHLHLYVSSPQGTYDLAEQPFDLATEAAFTLETELYKSDRQRISTNNPNWARSLG